MTPERFDKAEEFINWPLEIARLRQEIERLKAELDLSRAQLEPSRLAQKMLENQLHKAKERERQLQKSADLERNGYHQDRLTWNACEAQRTERKVRPLEDKIEELESTNTRLREALAKAAWWFGGSGDGGPSVEDVVSAIEAALTLPPAHSKPESYRLNSDPRIYDTDGPTEKSDD